MSVVSIKNRRLNNTTKTEKTKGAMRPLLQKTQTTNSTMRRYTKVIKVQIPVVFGLCGELASRRLAGKRFFLATGGSPFFIIAPIFLAFCPPLLNLSSTTHFKGAVMR